LLLNKPFKYKSGRRSHLIYVVTTGKAGFRLLLSSRAPPSAEVLFLRTPLAFYPERQVQPRRLNSARFSLILWSRLCNWKDALVIVKPDTLIGWHRKAFKAQTRFFAFASSLKSFGLILFGQQERGHGAV
jgi:hypothetical protein